MNIKTNQGLDKRTANPENGLGNSNLSLEVAVLSKIFQRFMQKSPIPVMVQVLLESVLSPNKLNALFERTAVEQYTRELLFSFSI